ncbi:PfkB family carbohydrate kinase [Amycolatopsis suaedae]|uniref:Ribokinase n=1 Tax=Amycolatopsis suaedae TaxID=2510978 RepID=A0A4Q7JBK9_9PSEU|nr:PfkB family carbohydrate kinase [Amycolatopsis suaedae]RZQ65211.1 ribokinase [Amycolatopsis suaedae]
MTVLLAGLSTVDVVQRVGELPEPGRKVQSATVAVAAGGPAANAAVTVAALGGDPLLLTVLGRHPLAGLARADLEAHGVRVTDLLPEHEAAPALSAVAVRERDGERTVVSHNAAGVPPITARLPSLEGVRVVLLDGHHPELAMAVATAARDRGIPVILDAGSWKPVFDDLLPLVDVAACSAQFRVPGPGLAERGVPVVVTTAGPEPVRWQEGGRSGAVAVPAVEARDTLGAGDVWHGAFAYGYGRPLPELIGFANEVAAERVRHAGPRTWVARVRARWEE